VFVSRINSGIAVLLFPHSTSIFCISTMRLSSPERPSVAGHAEISADYIEENPAGGYLRNAGLTKPMSISLNIQGGALCKKGDRFIFSMQNNSRPHPFEIAKSYLIKFSMAQN
jgi:hypothetical protein